MALNRESRDLKKLKAGRWAQFRLKQMYERIDWFEDALMPEVNAWLGQAKLPAPPSDLDIHIDYDSGAVAIVPPKPSSCD